MDAAKGANFRCLADSINPFFLVYACADCGIPLPENFSREFLWKHLDAIIGAKCWRGLGSQSGLAQASTSASVSEESSQPEFSTDEDPENIITQLLSGSYRSFSRRGPGPTPTGPRASPDLIPVEELQIVIVGKRWMARSSLGTVWSHSVCLDERDVACFAVMDLLARFLPSYWGVSLEIVTNDVSLLLGIYDSSMGGWGAVQMMCRSRHVRLRAKWAKLGGRDALPPTDFEQRPSPPIRDSKVVDAVVKKLEGVNELMGNDRLSQIVFQLTA